ncbi:STE/STE20/YSK protein kinase [Sporothrix schenckii ATCC 58251]|uniref:non-specific serine/threonine protein kinase n=1 Tax=Sporothrix schenckii (strain ATCC 58251 / de Perez 2211183) TaxID=1391915 RepID=U7Q4W7_SPOS1|nr:STE/STE20/YSK protein kinase [Sporothrix schenckii ATCC 58251]
MATLQVRGADYSATRQKAYDDAIKMQEAVTEECTKAGKEVPPYQLQELIGKGSYGRVYKAKDLKTSQLVAVKIIDIEESDTLDPKRADTYSEFLKEISALKLLRDGGSKNVNYFLDALPVAQAMWMITEYCAGGSVATLMRPTAPGGLQEKWIIPILREVAEAIYWVHRQGIIHRDIKCANVLVTEAGGVQLCDFGVAGVIETKFDKRSTVIGTPHWMAPEMFDQSASYGTEVDIWAFGSMVFEIASGLPPNVVAGVTYHQLGNYLKTHTPRLEGDKYSPQLKDLVAFCLADDPTQRPPIERVQRHPYIFGTSGMYPTDTLAMLVKGYKMWESQGGTRKSLFAPGGAQGPSMDNLASTALANDEWNFSTTLDFDRSVLDNPDSQAVYDVYGTQVDYETGRGGDSSSNGFGGFDDGHSGSTAGGGSFSGGATPRPSRLNGGRGRRRQPPPNLPVVKVPLEKVFDPDSITNYEENSREYYGVPPPPPTASATSTAASASDLPLRDDSMHSTLRESLIDLDASQVDLGGEPSQFADMETIRAGPGAAPRVSMDYNFSFGGGSTTNHSSNSNNSSIISIDESDYNRPPLSDPADLPNNRRTQEWKFPTMAPPASANPEMARFPFNEGETRSARGTPPAGSRAGSRSSNNNSNNNSISMARPAVLVHQHTDPVGLPSQGYETTSQGQGYDLMVPPLQGSSNNRMSVSSLIDLDESLPDPMPEMTRPSTANSDAVSMTGSDVGMANPFDLERHSSIYQPISATNREPSIYVSDDSEFAHMVAASVPDGGPMQLQQNTTTGLGLGQGSAPPPSFHINGVHGGSGSGSSIGTGDPNDEADRRQRRANEGYLHAGGGYMGDEYLEPRYAPDDQPYQQMGGSFNGGYRGGRGGFGGRGGLGGRGGGDRGGSLGQRMNRSNAWSGSGSGPGPQVGMAYSTDGHSNGHRHGSSDASANDFAVQQSSGDSSSISDGYGDGEFVDAEEYVSGTETEPDPDAGGYDDTGALAHRDTIRNGMRVLDDSFSLPPLPGPPSPHVMQGLGSREEVRDEMKRLLDSFKQHLSFTNTYVTSLPVRRAGVGGVGGVGGMLQDAQIDE